MIERVEINLLPAEYRVHKKGIRISRDVFYPILGLLIVVALISGYTFGLNAQIDQRKKDIANVESMIKANSYIKQQIAKLKADRAIIQEKIVALERINVNREKWVRLMEVMCQKLPDFTWLSSIEEKDQTPPGLLLNGTTLSFPEVANFMTRLQESNYIRGVDLSGINEVGGPVKMYSFSLSCTINPDAQIEQAVKDTATAKAPR
jgi:Tfp pilus assembly protein PilN